ncbi:MAG: YihY/virulence factor BrkB family protein [Arachnia sp.]
MKERIDHLLSRPAIAHVVAAYQRFNNRLGPQFAGAITYFTVLAFVPVLMFGVAMLGMTLTVLRPDLYDVIKDTIDAQLGNSDLAKDIGEVLDEAFASWRSTTAIALVTAGYAGSKWVGNLKRAFRAMWKPRLAQAADKRSFVGELIENLLIFLGLLLIFGIASAVTSVGSGLSDIVVGWLGLQDMPGIGVLLKLASIVASFLASWLLMAFVFLVLPGQTTHWRIWLAATVTGAVLLTVLQQLAGLVIGAFQGNAAASIFGPVIVLMLVFNLIATILLLISAWVGTHDGWDVDHHADEPDQGPAEVADGHQGADPAVVESPRTWADRRRQERWAARMSRDELLAVNFDPGRVPSPDPDRMVSEKTASASMKAGVGIGYGLGAATGLGLGAAATAVVRRITSRRRNSANP